MQLCFGCLHSFYPSAFEDGKCSFNEEVVKRFEGIRTIATKFQPTTPTARQHVADLEGEIKLLAKAMKTAIDDKDAEIAQLNAQVQFLGEQMEGLIRERQQNAAAAAAVAAASTGVNKKSPRGEVGGGSSTPRGGSFSFSPRPGMSPRAANALGASVVCSNLLDRFLLASKKMPIVGMTTPQRRRLSGLDSVGGHISTSVVGPVSGRPATTSGDFRRISGANMGFLFAQNDNNANNGSSFSFYKSCVSASVYSVLEALVVKTRAGMGVLWIKAPKSEGLAATFTAGRHGRRGGVGASSAPRPPTSSSTAASYSSATASTSGGHYQQGIGSTSNTPYFIGINSIPGSVASTGVVLNMAAEVPPLTPHTFVRDEQEYQFNVGEYDDTETRETTAASSDARVGGATAARNKRKDGRGGAGNAGGPSSTAFSSTAALAWTPATDHELLSNVCTQHSSLTVPVFTRYGAATRKTIAVLQLFGGSPAGAPFTIEDERLTESVSVVLSHMITTHYSSLASEWVARIFNPASLLSLSSKYSEYSSEVDQSPATKGADSLGTPPMFVFRGKYSGTLPAPPPPPVISSSAANAAEGGGDDDGDGGGVTFLTQAASSTSPSKKAGKKSALSVPKPPPLPNPSASSSSPAAPTGVGMMGGAVIVGPHRNSQRIKMRNLRSDLSEFSTPLEAYSGLRELGRYLDELEGLQREGVDPLQLVAYPSSYINNNNNNDGAAAGQKGGGGGGRRASAVINDGEGTRQAPSHRGATVVSSLPHIMAAPPSTAISSAGANTSAQAYPHGKRGDTAMLFSARLNPTNAGMVPSSASTAGYGVAAQSNAIYTVGSARQTTINIGAIESLEVDTISRLDALMAETRSRK